MNAEQGHDPVDEPAGRPLRSSDDLADWYAAARSASGVEADALARVTPDGLTVNTLYTANDVEGLQYSDTLPGFEPFVRGPHATMYAGRPTRSSLRQAERDNPDEVRRRAVARCR